MKVNDAGKISAASDFAAEPPRFTQNHILDGLLMAALSPLYRRGRRDTAAVPHCLAHTFHHGRRGAGKASCALNS